jgi:predicted phosphodiesterase
MPSFIPPAKRLPYPVLGSSLIERQIRKLNSDIHIYGHSHVNNRVRKDNTLYINNAFGYPHEVRITSKQLLCVFDI